MSSSERVYAAGQQAEESSSATSPRAVVKRARPGMRTVANVLMLFIPMAIVGHHFGLGPVFVFVCSALSCIPLSYRLGQAMEALGARLGPVSGGLLNATFGNAAELIIAITALSHGLLILVRTTLIGSILGQLLLVLGTSLLVAGLRHRELRFSKSLVQTNFTLLAIAMVAIGLPSLLLATAPDGSRVDVSLLSPTLAVLLMIIYGVTAFFALRSQPEEENTGGLRRSVRKSMLMLGGATLGLAFISELLVESILPFVEETGISQVFIGLILIPIFSNVVDHMVAISVALKNRMDLSLTISVGSAAQVACLVLPVIVLVSFAMGQPMGLVFTPVELISFGVGLLLIVPVLLDGDSNWLEGAQLLASYLILAVVLWVV